jgi:hypothetical protein
MRMSLFGFGENLWRRFLPKYLQSLGAPIMAIGVLGTAEDFLDGVYQHPGGCIEEGSARSLSLYYLCGSVAIAPAAFIGGLLWRVSRPLAFYIAALIGLCGVIAFVLTVKE